MIFYFFTNKLRRLAAGEAPMVEIFGGLSPNRFWLASRKKKTENGFIDLFQMAAFYLSKKRLFNNYRTIILK